MRLKERLRLIFLNLMQNKFKTLLTSLGIIVGVLTIVLVIAIGMGAEKEAEAQFSGLSADTIYVKNNYSLTDVDTKKLDKSLLDKILEEDKDVLDGYLRVSLYKEMFVGGQKEFLQALGVTEDFRSVSNLPLLVGRDFTAEEMNEGKESVIIGYGYATKYFETAENALNEVIFIDEVAYKIVGVLKRSSDGMQGMSPDETVFLPFETLGVNGLFYNPTMVLRATSVKGVQRAMAEIRYTLDYHFEDSASYIIEDAGSRIESATASARLMKTILISIAIIVFIVGGIGIMNVLFITIKERTKEIGILKALGFTEKSILVQFLIESVVIGIVSGLLGILLSIGFLQIFQGGDIAIYVSPWGKVLAMLFAVITSLVFGLYPSYKASKLEPVEALA